MKTRNLFECFDARTEVSAFGEFVYDVKRLVGRRPVSLSLLLWLLSVAGMLQQRLNWKFLLCGFRARKWARIPEWHWLGGFCPPVEALFTLHQGFDCQAKSQIEELQNGFADEKLTRFIESIHALSLLLALLHLQAHDTQILNRKEGESAKVDFEGNLKILLPYSAKVSARMRIEKIHSARWFLRWECFETFLSIWQMKLSMLTVCCRIEFRGSRNRWRRVAQESQSHLSVPSGLWISILNSSRLCVTAQPSKFPLILIQIRVSSEFMHPWSFFLAKLFTAWKLFPSNSYPGSEASSIITSRSGSRADKKALRRGHGISQIISFCFYNASNEEI